ncbi:hypothetical protein Z043-115543 [Arapaima gigas]
MASRKWSTVWLYYQRGEDANKVVCLICLEAIQHYGNTSNLLRHLRSKHRAEYADVEAKKRQVDGAGGAPQHRAKKAAVRGATGGTQPGNEIECTPGGDPTEQVQLKREMDRSGTVNGVHNGVLGSSITKPRKHSTVWEFYQDRQDSSEALCLLCSENIPYEHNSSQLLTHLQKRHPVQYSSMDSEAAELSQGPTSHCPLKRPVLREEACGSSRRDSDILQVLMVGETEQDQIRRALEQEARALERERELTAQLRRAQEQEARALERERELTEELRRVRDQERKAAEEQEERALERERRLVEQLRREHEKEMRRVQELEARVLERERRAIEQLGLALEQEARAIQREREALEQLRRELEQDRRALQRQPSGKVLKVNGGPGEASQPSNQRANSPTTQLGRHHP